MENFANVAWKTYAKVLNMFSRMVNGKHVIYRGGRLNEPIIKANIFIVLRLTRTELHTLHIVCALTIGDLYMRAHLYRNSGGKFEINRSQLQRFLRKKFRPSRVQSHVPLGTLCILI